MSARPHPPLALVRRPAASLASGCVSFIERQPLDVDLARRQWAAYVGALHAHGWPTIEVGPDDTLPDSVFIEDAVVMFGDLAVITSPGEPARRPETAAAAETVRRLGYQPAYITRGTFDGGDVLKVGRTAYVGLSGRTSRAAVAELRELLAPRGWEVSGVPLTKVLHLKSAVTALPDGTVIGYRPLVDDESAFPAFLGVPEEGGAHVVVLDEETVLMSAHAPRTADIFRGRGLTVVTVDISEFEKLEGCVTCLSVRIRG
ncbi:MAG TPA: N(G),N(G)-dimethylarginine dimethylaminohydrolase [Trebonia sp.]